jgi:phosphoglycerate dehydrogenase-like enzyme
MFRIGVTSDFLRPDGSCGFGDIGLDLLNVTGVQWEYLPAIGSEVTQAIAANFDGLLVLGPRVSQTTLAVGDLRLKIVARFGVGYDNIDVPACTEHGVLLTITPDGVRRPVAVAAMTFLLSLSHKLLIKDRLTRDGRWSEKLHYNGQGVTGRTLGIIGFGNIGRELARLTKPFEMKVVASDPWATAAQAAAEGVSLLSLNDLLASADFVCITCALTEQTRGLIGQAQLARMKSNAYLINVARGPIVDQAALTQALQSGQIAGAGLDVFDPEPVSPDDPLLELDNVILAPHAICWTDECFALNGRSAIESLLAVAAGRLPTNIVNRDAIPHRRLAHLVA